MTDYTDLKRRLERFDIYQTLYGPEKSEDGEWVRYDDHAAAIAALEAEVERVAAIANIGLDGWQAIADDLLQGADWYDEVISEIAAARAAITSPQPAPPADKT